MGDSIADGLLQMFKMILTPNLLGGISDLSKTVTQFNGSAYSFATSINSTVIKPIAATILAIVLVLELARIGARFDGDQKMGVQQVASAIIKAVLVVVAIQNVDLILKAINEVSDRAIVAISASNATSGQIALPSKDTIEGAGMLQQLGTFGVLLIPFLLSVAASIVVKIIVFVRFAEIYVLTAAATLPLVFMAHPETKGISVGYLKKYASAVLQGVVLLIIVKIFTYFKVTPAFTKITSDNLLGTTAEQFPALILGSVVFIVLVVSSGKLARALVGE